MVGRRSLRKPRDSHKSRATPTPASAGEDVAILEVKIGCGGGICTPARGGKSPTSYQTAPPRAIDCDAADPGGPQERARLSSRARPPSRTLNNWGWVGFISLRAAPRASPAETRSRAARQPLPRSLRSHSNDTETRGGQAPRLSPLSNHHCPDRRGRLSSTHRWSSARVGTDRCSEV